MNFQYIWKVVQKRCSEFRNAEYKASLAILPNQPVVSDENFMFMIIEAGKAIPPRSLIETATLLLDKFNTHCLYVPKKQYSEIVNGFLDRIFFDCLNNPALKKEYIQTVKDVNLITYPDIYEDFLQLADYNVTPEPTLYNAIGYPQFTAISVWFFLLANETERFEYLNYKF